MSAVEPAGGPTPRRRGGTRAASLGVSALMGLGAAAGAIFFVGAAVPVGLLIGAVFGVGAALLFTPRAPDLLELPGERASTPSTVIDSLNATRQSVDRMEQAMRSLQSRPLWHGSNLDERLHHLLSGIRTLANTPALQQRGRLDGDVHMLHTLATDYLPTIVNLVIENDRMHSSFSGRSARAEVEKNVHSLEQQAAVLGEALERIEADVVRGTTRSVYEHAAFLELRFQELGAPSLLDLQAPVQAAVPRAESGAESGASRTAAPASPGASRAVAEPITSSNAPRASAPTSSAPGATPNTSPAPSPGNEGPA